MYALSQVTCENVKDYLLKKGDASMVRQAPGTSENKVYTSRW